MCQPRELAKPSSKSRFLSNAKSRFGQMQVQALKKQLSYPVSPTHTGFSWYNRENSRQANNWKNWRNFLFRHSWLLGAGAKRSAGAPPSAPELLKTQVLTRFLPCPPAVRLHGGACRPCQRTWAAARRRQAPIRRTGRLFLVSWQKKAPPAAGPRDQGTKYILCVRPARPSARRAARPARSWKPPGALLALAAARAIEINAE
jgi:hypothetical protein